MKNLQVETDLNVKEIDEILQDFGIEKGSDDKEGDFYGASAEGEIVTIHLDDNFEDEETIKELLKHKFIPNIEMTWQNFRENYQKSDDQERKVSLIARYLGLERPPTKEVVSFEIPKNNLDQMERDTMEQKIESLGIPFGFTMVDGEIKIVFEKQVPKDLKKDLKYLVNIWLEPNEKSELNWDLDSENTRIIKERIKNLSERFGKKNLQIRHSAHDRIHLRVKDKLYDPEKVVEIRKETNDSSVRTKYDERKLKHGLKPDFLYDMKYGKPAGEWMSIDEFKEMKGWS